MDTATASLERITKGGNYTPVRGIPVFDEHDEYDDNGKVIRRFDRAALQRIVDVCNRRARETGDLSPFGPGHTITGAPEEKQPPKWGYALNYRLGHYGPGKKLGILADFYVKKKVRTSDRQTVDGLDEFLSFPQRSIELWLKDGFIDHIALLRTTPQRDLGLVEYSKENHQVTVPSTGQLWTSAGPSRRSYAAAVRGGKLCYAMESQMLPPNMNKPAMGDDNEDDVLTPPQDEIDPNGEEHKQFSRHADAYLKRKYGTNLSKYEMAGSPSGTNPFTPGEDDDDPMKRDLSDPTKQPGEDDVVKMAKAFQNAPPEVQAVQFARVVKQLAVLKNAKAEESEKAREIAAKACVTQLAAEGVVIPNANKEILKFSKCRTDEERSALMDDIRESYAHDVSLAYSRPVRGGMVNVGGGRTAPTKYSKEQCDAAREHALAKGIDYKTALTELYGAK